MTKHIRIENADNSDYKVLVQTWDKGYPAGAPDYLSHEEVLGCPTAMTRPELYITDSRYLVVKELRKGEIYPYPPLVAPISPLLLHGDIPTEAECEAATSAMWALRFSMLAARQAKFDDAVKTAAIKMSEVSKAH